MYITIDNFQKYSNVFTDNIDLQQSYINTAENIVESYLGYTLKLSTRIIKTNGTGTNELQLKAKPIKNIFKVLINDIDISPNMFDISNEFIYYKNGIFPTGNRNITVIYEAGYDTTNFIPTSDTFDGGDAINDNDIIGDAGADFTGNSLDGGDAFFRNINNTIPQVILMTILRIATILQSEADSNIGVTSKSFGDSGTRTFINYTDFNKYLSPISEYKLIRI